MGKSMTPAKRHQMRAMAEKKDQDRKNARLGIKPIKVKKGKRR